MTRFYSVVLFLALFSFSAFAQSSLIDYGRPAVISGTSIVKAPMAPVVFLDQAPNAVNGLFADSSYNGSLQQSIADNFVVTAAGPTYGITEIVIWGGYFSENIPNPTDDFTIIIHSDAGGVPGANIYARYNLQATSRATTGVVLFGVDEYLFTFDFSASPFIITNTGTYWIEIYNNSTASSSFFWETGNLDATHGIAGSVWTTTTPGVTWNVDAATNLSIQISGDDNAVVPVELKSFNASADVNSVNLSWSTATETNNSGFQVERSSGSEYQSVGFIAGHGTTTEIQNYSFVDQNVAAGNYTYRLKQVDFNGTFEYSNTIGVEVIGVKEFTLGQNYPNPFNPSTTINFSLAVDSKVILKIFDVLGQEVATLVNGQLAAGNKKVSFNASSLNSGVYFYRIDANGIDGQKFSSVKKMILTK